MDMTSLLVKLLPASVLPYLKFVVTVLGGAASAALAAYPGLNVDPRWVALSAALTAITTYLTPNVQPVKQVAVLAESVDPDDVASASTELEPQCCKPNTDMLKPAETAVAAPVKTETATEPHEVGV